MSTITKYMNFCLKAAEKLSAMLIIIVSIAFSQNSKDKPASEFNIKTDLQFLASDELEGRETGFRGQKVAAKYIEAEFKKANLKQLDGLNSYFQSFPLVRITTDYATNFSVEDTSKIILKFKNYGEDYFQSGRSYDTTITGDALFVGYGLTIKEVWSDIDTNINYEGKILILLSGLPKTFDSTQIKKYSFYGSTNFKLATARRLKASGVILISENEKSLKDNFSNQYANMLKGSITDPANVTQRDIPLLISTYEVGTSIFGNKNIFSNSLNQLLQNKGITQNLNKKITINTKVKIEKLTSENVIGVIEGSDAKLKKEYVIITSHFDHVGVNLLNGNIYNGADDDGSGTVAVLELARIFSKSKIKPKRSLIFMPVSGEEKGLLGSRYFVNNPPLDLASITSNINIDMIGRTDEKHDSLKQDNYIYVIGSDKISKDVDSLLLVANKKHKLNLDYTFNSESDPNRFYYRSDHYNFAEKGIPVIFFFSGVHVDYHQPTDDAEKIRFDLHTQRTNLIYSTILQLANYPKAFNKIVKK